MTERPIPITLISAVAENDVIGNAGGLPWRLADDLRRFKRRTMSHAVIMGRTTFESVGTPLLGRDNIVLTTNPAWGAPGVKHAPTIAMAIDLAQRYERAHHADSPEVFVIGGAQVYAAAMPLATRLDLTLVHAAIDGDTRFPAVDWSAWKLIESEHRDASPPANQYACTFRVFERVG